jgi:hypothetical protein
VLQRKDSSADDEQYDTNKQLGCDSELPAKQLRAQDLATDCDSTIIALHTAARGSGITAEMRRGKHNLPRSEIESSAKEWMMDSNASYYLLPGFFCCGAVILSRFGFAAYIFV